MTFLITLFARWGLPESIRRPLALLTGFVAVAALCGLLWTCWLRDHDDDVIDRHEGKVASQVAKATEAANIKADQAVTATQTKVEQTNAQARDAAAISDDPLRSGFDSLRAGKGQARPSAR